MGQKYFCAYHSYLEWLENLSDAEKGRLFVACLEYSASGTEPVLPGSEKIIFPAIRRQIDRDREKYEKKCEINRANGALGGQANGKRSEANGKRTVSERPPKEKGKGKLSAKADIPPTPLEGAIESFKEHRKAMRKVMTDHAVDLLRKRLEELAPNDENAQIALIEHAIMKGWQTVYPIRDDDIKTKKEPSRSTKAVIDPELLRISREAFGE